MENADPWGAVVNNLIEKTNTESESIRDELKKFSECNVSIHIASTEFNDVDPQSGADPASYKADLDYILAVSEYKYNQVDNTVTQRMRLVDIAKGSIQTRVAKLQANSQPSSRNNSPNRAFMMRSNADSMKPPLITYSSATLITINDHMRNVLDWIHNMFPWGYSIPQYRSNLNSTLDKEFRRKTNYFTECQSEEEIRQSIDALMEIKFPIHLRRMEAIKPELKSNEEASTFFSRVQLDFQNSKMKECSEENLLLHITLSALPDNEIFRKQCDFISQYLSEIGQRTGNASKANINYVKTRLVGRLHEYERLHSL